MPTLVASGTLSTSASEQTLATIAAAGVYMLVLDTNALVEGEILIPRCRRRVLATGTERVALRGGLSDAPRLARMPIQQSEPISAPHGCAWSLQQPLGSARSIPWAIYRIGTPYVLLNTIHNGLGSLSASSSLQTLAISGAGSSVGMSFDLGAMVEGDVLMLRVMMPALVFGTSRTVWEEIFSGAQAIAAVQTPPFINGGVTLAYQRVGPSGNIAFDYSLEAFDV